MNINKDFKKLPSNEEIVKDFLENSFFVEGNPNNHFLKSQFPLEEAIAKSNLAYLKKMDEEYTAKAQAEGKAYYKWDTNSTMMKIYTDMIEMGEWGRIAEFISIWLTLTLKFEELDPKFEYLFNEFLEGRYHYKDEYMGQEIYKYISSYIYKGGYIYAIMSMYLENKGLQYPPYIYELAELWMNQKKFKMNHALPNEDGSALIDAEDIDIAKYLGEWISPERKKELDEEWERILAKHKEDKK